MSNTNHPYFIPIRFRGADRSYYFSTDMGDLQVGELVVVDSQSGYTMGTVNGPAKSLAEYHSELDLKPVLRRPTKSDMLNHKFNLKEEKRALEIVDEQIKKLGLPMDLVDAVFTLDGTYITITYTSPEKRVDFRELLHVINPMLNCRVELRQIAPRDRAKLTGGIGICGLPLCCSTFLTNFESISIGKAKNQMLTLNIPKLSGHCGKLICCLNYEDENYTEAKKLFPRPGTTIHTPDGDYNVDSFNIISKMVRLSNAAHDDFKVYELDDILAMQAGTYKEHIVIKKKKEDELPNFGIVPDNLNAPAQTERENRPNNPQQNQQQQQQNQGGHGRHKHRHGNRPNNPQQQQGQNNRPNNQRPQNPNNRPQNPQNQQQNPNESRPNGNQQGNRNRRHHFHGHRNHHRGGGNNGGNAQ